MRHALRLLGAAFFFLHGPFAFAELVCVARDNTPGSIDCENRSGAHLTTVTYRNIPPWGGNAGATLVDICDAIEFVPLDKDAYQQMGYAVIDGTDQDSNMLSAKQCVRRYCSQDSSVFMLRANGLVFPIAPALWATLSVGFNHARFEIRCETLR